MHVALGAVGFGHSAASADVSTSSPEASASYMAAAVLMAAATSERSWLPLMAANLFAGLAIIKNRWLKFVARALQ